MTTANGDRNLLFGILALQMDFISRDALVAAMHAWVLDKAKPLSQIPVEEGALSAARRVLLEPLVQEHIQQHGGDASRSLGALSSVGSARDVLKQIADPDVQASFSHLPAADPNATKAPSVGDTSAVGRRFLILRPHDVGGLGKVSVALDGELNREVALKEIREEFADRPDSRSRFLLEAEITGGLEHPSIVPVYGLGQYEDGRPFYAMRFIKGDSLKEAVERFHKGKGPINAGKRALELRQLLGRFNDVCDAVAYAHSRGVLHRDLKPGNVMLGKCGETLVVDWGLAKPVGGQASKDDDAESPLQPSSADGSAPTQMGSAIGTPQFMPPEQAAGRLDQMGPASDVYSLGSTLYCLLTGKPPFTDREVGVVLQKVQRGDFPPPRQLRREIPPALEAICLKAMALRPADRYSTARALAGDVEKWLADEPVSAYREPWRVRAGRWLRRNQTMTAATAAGLLVAILAGGAGVWILERQSLERRQAVETALSDVGHLQLQARWGEARAVLDQAKRRLEDGGPGDLKTKLDRTQDELDLVERLDAIRLKKAELVHGRIDMKRADQAYEETFRQAGMAQVGSDAAAAAWVNASGVRENLIAALDDWAASVEGTRRPWLFEVVRRADPDPWRDRARDPAVWNDRAALAKLLEGEEAVKQSPQLLDGLGRRLTKLGGNAEGVLREAQTRNPGDYWVNLNLGIALYYTNKGSEAVGFWRAALAARPETSITHNNLGTALYDQGEREEAATDFRKAIELDPTFALPHNNLGNVLYDQGKRDEAAAEYRKAIALDPKYAVPHVGLGDVLRDQGKRDEAAAEYRKAINLDPNRPQLHYTLGTVLSDQRKREAAIAEYHKAIQLDPKFAPPHNGLGIVLFDQGKREEAAAEFRKAVELDPKLPEAYGALGQILFRLGQFSEARQATQQCLDLLPAKDPRRNFVSQQLNQCEQLLVLDKKLAAVLKGKAQPADAAEQVTLAALCSLKNRHADAARFYAGAFTAQPALANNLQESFRYNAARAAVLTAGGQGEGADKVEDKERIRLRQQALDWLQADLALWGKQAENGTPETRGIVQQTLRRWQANSDLASVRDAAALDKLPEAERAAWKKLWADVADLLKKSSKSGKK